MSNKHIADGEAGFYAVSSTPDCCEVGGTVVPFDSYQSLDKLKVYPTSMTARGRPVLNVGSVIAGTQGNAGAGVVSGTSLGSGDCEITSGSPTVSLEGKPIARHGSDVAMNNNNCVGKLITATGTPDGEMLHHRLPCNNPPVSSALLEWLQKKKEQTAVVSEVLDKGGEMIDFSNNINELDKKAEEAIKAIRPEKIDDRFLFADTANDMREIGAGISRAGLHFARSLVSGTASLGNMAGQVMYKKATFMYDPATSLDSAILAENIRLGNVCVEGMTEEAKNKLENLQKAATEAVGKIWDEQAEKWEKGTIGDKAEIVTRVGLEMVTLVAAPTKVAQAGKVTAEVGQAVKVEAAVADATRTVKAAEAAAQAAKGTDGLHIDGLAKAAKGTMTENVLQYGKLKDTPIWTATTKLDPVPNAYGHWIKHGSEFPGLLNSKQYVDAAHNFVRTPPAGTLIKARTNGDIMYYHPSTNTFAVKDVNNVPRTMFKPKQEMKYWDRQVGEEIK